MAFAKQFLIPLAVLKFEFPILEKAFYPYVIGSQTVPVFAIAPLLVLWFGFGIVSKVIMAALIVFFAIVLNTLDGLKSSAPDTVNLFRILRATRCKYFRKCRFHPHSRSSSPVRRLAYRSPQLARLSGNGWARRQDSGISCCTPVRNCGFTCVCSNFLLNVLEFMPLRNGRRL